jgi:ADP-heptose:LPS heptosyltransferase
MGDILMSIPAISSLKKALGCRITLLTSSMGQPIVPYLPAIDDVIVFDVPWVKLTSTPPGDESTIEILSILKSRKFDGAVIFTVFSQSALPTALLLYLADIPLRLAYCRENPYGLLTDWVPDQEPYTLIRHQVERDLCLVEQVGIKPTDEEITLDIPHRDWKDVVRKLVALGVDPEKPYIILHPSVSEPKREYAIDDWIHLGKTLDASGYQIVLTGTKDHIKTIEKIRQGIGPRVVSLAGLLSVGELITLIDRASLLITVNTMSAHLAAAVKAHVIVLYAATNPQHTPWKCNARIFTFPVPDNMQSRNEVLRYVAKRFDIPGATSADPERVAHAALQMLQRSRDPYLILDGSVPSPVQ